MPDSPRLSRPTPTPGRSALTTKTPYLPLEDATSYERAPAGFRVVGTQVVCRHGSRTPTTAGGGAAVVSLWRDAAQQDSLTAQGRSVAQPLRDFVEQCSRVGAGALTETGRLEMAGIAQRLALRHPSLLQHLSAAGHEAELEVVSASKRRTQDSAVAFVAHLNVAVSGTSISPSPICIDDGLLYFHKSDESYQTYVKRDTRLQKIRSAARDLSETRSAARDVLVHNFTTAFVDRLAAGHLARLFPDELQAAQAVFALWQVAAGSSSGTGRSLVQLVPPAAAAWFGYLDDLDTFYAKGPGFAGDDITYSMARALLGNILAHLEATRSGRRAGSVRLCFTHAEEILPLATLLGLPGSDRPVAEAERFTYATNEFRGAKTAPMAANVQWDLYADGSTHLVRMLHNERQTPFAAGCSPIADGSYFYRLTDVLHRYGFSPP